MKKRVLTAIFGLFCLAFCASIFNKNSSDFIPKLSRKEILKIADKEAAKLGFDSKCKRSYKVEYLSDYINYVTMKFGSDSLNEFEKTYGSFLRYEVSYKAENNKSLVVYINSNGEISGFKTNTDRPLSQFLGEEKADETLAKKLALAELKAYDANFKENLYSIDYTTSKEYTASDEDGNVNINENISDSNYSFKLTRKDQLDGISLVYFVTVGKITSVLKTIELPESFNEEYARLTKQAFNNYPSLVIVMGALVFVIAVILIVYTFIISFNLVSKRKDIYPFVFILTLLGLDFELMRSRISNAIFLNGNTDNLLLSSLFVLLISASFALLIFSMFINIGGSLLLNEAEFPKHANFRSIFKSSFLASKEYLSLVTKGYGISLSLILLQAIFCQFESKYFNYNMNFNNLKYYAKILSSNIPFLSTIFSSFNSTITDIFSYTAIVSLILFLYRKYSNKVMLVTLFLFQLLNTTIINGYMYEPQFLPLFFVVLKTVPLSFILMSTFYLYGFIPFILANLFYGFFISFCPILFNPSTFALSYLNWLVLTAFGLIPILAHLYFKYYKQAKGEFILNEDVNEKEEK